MSTRRWVKDAKARVVRVEEQIAALEEESAELHRKFLLLYADLDDAREQVIQAQDAEEGADDE